MARLRSRLLFGSVVILIVVGGCGQSATTPSPSVISVPAPTTVAPPRTFQPSHVVGHVLDTANNPVANATLTQWDTVNTAITDEHGAFDLTALITATDRSLWVTVEKPGYETSEQARSIENIAHTTLRLHPIQTIPAGESFTATVSADDSACGYHWGYVCRRVRIAAGRTGILNADVSGSVLGIATLSDGLTQFQQRRLSVPVNIGTELTIDIGAGWDIKEPATFVLDTALTPRN